MRRGIRVVMAIALTSVVLGVPGSASAAAPANDDFASREVLSGALPIEVTRSNAEATKEEGELISPFGAGHSIWFEWEAPATEWVTVGICDDQFPSLLGVFTGTDVKNLTPVAKTNQEEGPDCLYQQRQYTFKAVAGTKYVIGVDGNAFTLPPPPEGPPPPPPVTEGEAVLRIEPTPPPPNDDFANATPIDGWISEEPGGARRYFAPLQGYNWKATTEAGEFPYGTNSGASVWYRLTPPESASYRISLALGETGLNLAVFSGGFGLENEIVAASGWTEVELAAGSTYWVAVYGTPDAETGEPVVGSFSLYVSADLPPLPPAPEVVPPPAGAPPTFPDTTSPETLIDRTSLRATTRSAKFWFSASEPAQGFLCRIDKGDFKPCGSPRAFKHLKPGSHAFRVKAVDMAGLVDGSAAVARFKVPERHKRR